MTNLKHKNQPNECQGFKASHSCYKKVMLLTWGQVITAGLQESWGLYKSWNMCENPYYKQKSL